MLPSGLLPGELAGPLVKMLPPGLSRGVLSGRFVNTLPAGPFPRALSGRLGKMLPDGRLDGEGPGRGLSIRADGLPGEAVRDISRDGAGERPPRISGALRLSRALGAEPRSGPRSREPCGDAQQAELKRKQCRIFFSLRDVCVHAFRKCIDDFFSMRMVMIEFFFQVSPEFK